LSSINSIIQAVALNFDSGITVQALIIALKTHIMNYITSQL